MCEGGVEGTAGELQFTPRPRAPSCRHFRAHAPCDSAAVSVPPRLRRHCTAREGVARGHSVSKEAIQSPGSRPWRTPPFRRGKGLRSSTCVVPARIVRRSKIMRGAPGARLRFGRQPEPEPGPRQFAQTTAPDATLRSRQSFAERGFTPCTVLPGVPHYVSAKSEAAASYTWRACVESRQRRAVEGWRCTPSVCAEGSAQTDANWALVLQLSSPPRRKTKTRPGMRAMLCDSIEFQDS